MSHIRRHDLNMTISETVTLWVNRKPLTIPGGCTVATAVFESGAVGFRRSVAGEPRAPLCGMGVCYECRVTIDGVRHRRSCQVLAEDGMEIATDGQDHD